jgi:AraC family transcriptional regulator
MSVQQSNFLHTDRITKKSRPAFPGAPVLSSEGMPWNGLLLEQHSLAPQELPEVTCRFHMIIHQLSESSKLECRVNGRFKRMVTAADSIGVHPLNAVRKTRLLEGADIVVLSLDASIMERAASESVYGDRIQLVQKVGIHDEQISCIIMALRGEVAAGGRSGRLFGESLAYALAAHLLAKYSQHGTPITITERVLPQRRLRRAVEFINENLGKDISLDEIACEVGISPYHFARLFKQATGRSPHRYLMERRIERAKTLLTQTDQPLVMISCSLGFQSQSHFTALFRKFTSTTPLKYRKGA